MNSIEKRIIPSIDKSFNDVDPGIVHHTVPDGIAVGITILSPRLFAT